MDASGNIIPIVEDDQGEGFMDPIDEPYNKRLTYGVGPKELISRVKKLQKELNNVQEK